MPEPGPPTVTTTDDQLLPPVEIRIPQGKQQRFVNLTTTQARQLQHALAAHLDQTDLRRIYGA